MRRENGYCERENLERSGEEPRRTNVFSLFQSPLRSAPLMLTFGANRP